MHAVAQGGRAMNGISMGDVAKDAGCSRSTVSRALRHDPRLPKATIDRIQAVAAKLGYRPDPAFNILAARRQAARAPTDSSLNLAYLDFENHEDPAISRSAAERAKELGYAFEAFVVSRHPSMEALDRILWNRGIRGILLPILQGDDPQPNLQWDRYSVIACGVDELRLPFHTIRPNVFSKVLGSWRACREQGYRRIGAAFPVRQSHELDLRRVGTIEALTRDLPEGERIPLWTGAFDGRTSFRRWLRQWEPEAVILGYDFMQDWFQDDSSEPAPPPHCALMVKTHLNMAGYRTPYELIGRTAMNLLDQEIRHFSRGIPENPFTVMVEPEWHAGITLPKQQRGALRD